MDRYNIEYVNFYVESKSMGIYLFSRNGYTVDYVGRSDNDINARIKSSAKEGYGYKYFWFDYATSPMDAYKKECFYYHKYNPPDNSIHPAVPSGTNWRCPVDGCEWS